CPTEIGCRRDLDQVVLCPDLRPPLHEEPVATHCRATALWRGVCPRECVLFFFFKQKTAYEIGLGIPAEPLFRSFLLVLILLLMPTLNFLPVWFALSLLRFPLPSRLPMMFILWMVAMMVVIIPSRTV